MKLPLFLWLIAVCAASCAPAEFDSSDRQTTLLELYTSEGCSSCPPAEIWLSKLRNASGLWTNFVPVAFHVDYWNHLGWRDALSQEQFSARQQAYAQLWSAGNIYTPEFVLDGKEWRNWLGLRAAPASNSHPGSLRVNSPDGRHWSATFTPLEQPAGRYELTAAVLVSGLGTDVKAGENAGRHLNHDFAALSLVTVPLVRQTNGCQGRFILDDKPKGLSGRLAIAVWVTRAGQLEPLQATGGWLPEPEKH